MICIPYEVLFSGDQIKKSEIGGTRGKYARRREIYTEI